MTDKITAKGCGKPERYCLGLNETHVSCDNETKYGNKTYTCSCSSTSCFDSKDCERIYKFDEECDNSYHYMNNDIMIPFVVVACIGLLYCCFKAMKRTHYRRDRYGNQVAQNILGRRLHNEIRRRPQRKTILRLTTYILDDIELVDYNADEISENHECVICLDKLKEEESKKDENERQIAKLKCNHYFHRKCISNWFDQKPDCPICRGTVVTNEETVEITI
jgi:hypothetical protein